MCLRWLGRFFNYGREPWSSGYGLMFWKFWVRIPVPYTGWTFFTLICCKIVLMFVLKRRKLNEKEAGLAHFLCKRFLIMDQTQVHLCHFRRFHKVKTIVEWNLTVNKKLLRGWCAWVPNPRMQDGRGKWTHWAIAAP